ncbi:ecdysone 20-monooxygenase [Anthonomus grandis grandis]|nr:ecdysone 20-monooxygenase [Anthonomus grandis grandis]
MFDYLIHILAMLFTIFIGYRPPWIKKKLLQNFPAKKDEPKVKTVRDIPGPFSLPILGTRWLFTLGLYQTNKIHLFYEEMRDKYGRIFKEEALFNIPVINIFDKEDMEKVLKSAGKYPIRPPTEAIAKYRRSHPERYASTGLTNEQGERWHFLRTSLTNVLTSPKTIHDFLPEVGEIADDWCNAIKQKRNKEGYVANLDELTGKLALEATCALVLGRRMGFLIEGEKCEAAEGLAEAVHKNFIACRDTYFGLPLWKLFPTSSYKNLCNSEKVIYELASELIRTADENTMESPVFQSVLKAHIDEREKKSAIVDFLAAGIYTLKNSLLFLLYQVAMNPECQQKILDDSTKAYLKACSTETYRLSPTVNSLARVIDTNLELGGYQIPAGSVILCHSALACQNEMYFKDAKKFRPERWLDEEKQKSASAAGYILTPFGYGKRICPGKRFIEQVLPVILDKMVQTFVINVDRPMELEFEFLLSPKGHTSMRFDDRT